MKALAATGLAAALIALPLAALAQGRPRTEAKAACAAVAAPPAELAGWEKPAPLPAARRPAELTAAELTPGKAVTAQLFPVADIEYRVPPQKADGPAVYGGLYELRIAEAGTYRVASSAGPWMDIFTGVTPVVSTAHGHGPPCTGVGKYVDFPLSPGDYLVQFSESLTPKTEIMVAKVGRE